MWKALRRAGETAPRCQVQRLMREHGIQGAKRRGKPWRTTRPDLLAHRRPDLVQRQFTAEAPNRLWVGDLSYLRCWEGVVFFSFVIDVFSRRVVGWQLAGHMRTDLVLDALRMALGTREPGADFALVAHTDRGSQPGLNRSSQQYVVRGTVGGAGDGRWWCAHDQRGGLRWDGPAVVAQARPRAGRSGDSRVRACADPPPARLYQACVTAGAGREVCQVVVDRNSLSASAGVLQLSVLRGRPFSAAATATRSSAPWRARSVPRGKYWRSSPLVFSLLPRCHGLCGSQK